MPVFAYMREERLRQAHQLLLGADIPVGIIGEHLGYTNPANFASAVRKRYGASPRQVTARQVFAPRFGSQP